MSRRRKVSCGQIIPGILFLIAVFYCVSTGLDQALVDNCGMILIVVALVLVGWIIWRFINQAEVQRRAAAEREARLRQIAHLNQLVSLEPREFEELVADLFAKDGYQVSLTKESADSGVDLYLHKQGRRGVVQCKKTAGKVGERVIRDLAGTMQHENAEWGYVVTTGEFTQPARNWAEGKPIKLVDRFDLLAWKERLFPTSEQSILGREVEDEQ